MRSDFERSALLDRRGLAALYSLLRLIADPDGGVADPDAAGYDSHEEDGGFDKPVHVFSLLVLVDAEIVEGVQHHADDAFHIGVATLQFFDAGRACIRTVLDDVDWIGQCVALSLFLAGVLQADRFVAGR